MLEERGFIHPMFVTEWLLRALGGCEVSHSQEQENACLKKVRDEARYGRGMLLWQRCLVWFALRSSVHFATRLTIGIDNDSDLLFKLWVTDVLGTLYTCESSTLYNTTRI